ncbi:MAG: hypothetical protein Kow002_01100 [Anaerolineales bacterium]
MNDGRRYLLLFCLAAALIAGVASSPIPVDPYTDFQALYHANLGVLRGVPFYDWDGQVNMIAELAGVEPAQVLLNPFAYPPWYALITLPLAMLPIHTAARVWFAINFLMVIVSAWLMSAGWPPLRRLLSLLAAVMFLPVLGTLVVGQFTFPVLLGAAILLYALPRERSWLTTLGLVLLTFKPHMGGLVFLAILVHLFVRQDRFARGVFWRTGAVMVFLFAAGFLVDQGWPVHYLEKLFVFRGVSQCEGLCISLPMLISSWLRKDSLPLMLLTGLLLLGWSGWFIGSRPKVWNDAGRLLAVGICITLLSSPYQYNYDFVILLAPLFVFASRAKSKVVWIVLALAYVLPWAGLFFGRQGNAVLLLSAFALLILLWQDRA